eukprot:GHVP01032195.1.p1 GENE.GHVP01032195.1~~GHVP01032195.1.p1  ORF type:complete len:110 (+),score=0.64 GHVP01032195.1:29-358(+)
MISFEIRQTSLSSSCFPIKKNFEYTFLGSFVISFFIYYKIEFLPGKIVLTYIKVTNNDMHVLWVISYALRDCIKIISRISKSKGILLECFIYRKEEEHQSQLHELSILS